MASESVLAEAKSTFESLTCQAENFLSIQENSADVVRHLTKKLYDFTKSEEESLKISTALPELVIKGFDEEQIWQEIELQNEDKWTYFLSNVSKLVTKKDSLNIPVNILEDNPIDETQSDENDNDEIDVLEKNIVLEKKVRKKKKKQKIKPTSIKKKGSIVDDQFFKLNDLEAFLEVQDKEEMKKIRNENKPRKDQDSSDDDEEEEDEEIDMFADIDSNDEGIEKMEEDEPKPIKYNDFFDSKDDSDESEEESKVESDDLGFDDNSGDDLQHDNDNDSVQTDDEQNEKKGKKVRFSLSQPSSDDESSEDDDKPALKKKVDDTEGLSEFQLRQQRLSKKIGHLENNLIEEKSWPMKGEVTASSRPQNSLLEEVLDFDMTSRPAPVITEETTVKLQDIIIQRIKDKAWDDVERKIKPVQEVQEFKKQLVLDQEKSKLSLAQVYEQEYIKQREALDPDADDKQEEEPKEHIEIRGMMASLFSKLDALGNFHYTPKVAIPEVKIVSNMPAISMEEVAPVATSDATLLAPEEIKGKTKGDIVGKTERTDTDKKRERRQKKTRQREKEKQKEKRNKILDKIQPGLGNKYSREKASKLLDKVTKDRNVEKMETMGDGKSLKSSSAFFSQLQDEVSSSIKTKLKTKKEAKKSLSAKKLKL